MVTLTGTKSESKNEIFKVGFLRESYTDTITAFAGGGQANATPLLAAINRITTVATAGDSVLLPALSSDGGAMVCVMNSAANATQVFGSGTDIVNDTGATVGVSLPGNTLGLFTSAGSGKWYFSPLASTVDSDTFNNITLTGLLSESVTGGLTANATGTQVAALALTTELNRVTTAANTTAPFSAVALMAATAGLTILVINKGANPIQVFPNGTDAIDSLAASASVTQMANSMVLYTCTTAGNWDSEGLGTGYSGSLQTMLFATGITAFSTGGQTSAVALTAMINRVSTVAAQGDSVKLPPSAPGLEITVINRGANPMQVFGAGTDTVNGIVTTTGISQGIQTAAVYVCSVAGNWEVPITSLQTTVPAALTTNGAIPPHVSHTYVITKAGVYAATLAAPTATTDDGIEITLTSATANAHTLTATGLLQTGTASVNLATFAAHPGAGLTLMAYQGLWQVMTSVGITFT